MFEDNDLDFGVNLFMIISPQTIPGMLIGLILLTALCLGVWYCSDLCGEQCQPNFGHVENHECVCYDAEGERYLPEVK